MVFKHESPLRCLLFAIETGKMLPDIISRGESQAFSWLESPEEYERRFGIWPEVLTFTEAVAERCTYGGPAGELIMPPWYHAGRKTAAEVLRKQAYCGARRRYGADLSEVVVDRLEYELHIIEQMNFSSYFLVVRDIVHPPGSSDERTQRRVCGRGSGAASLVAYCLEITNVCPIQHNLYFERFLNPGRKDPPDIDVDFAWDERDQVLAGVFDQYGQRAAMVSSHVGFKPRMAIRETARAYGLSEFEISKMTGRLPWIHRYEGDELHHRIREIPSLKDQDLSGPWPHIIRRADMLVGLPRYMSVHPGGVVITPGPVSDYVPVERAAKGVPIIQWDKDGAEEAGLVKIDLLGNRSLAVIRDSIGNIRKNGISFSEHGWVPENDPATKKKVGSGGTMGCFYIESPAMRLLQQKAASGEFEQLVIQSSIIRPAANEFVREYVRRLHGGHWEPLHAELEEVLDETFGLMVYQEDVSRVAVALAGFSHSDGDGLRKILSKKDREHRLRDYREDFYNGCRRRGLDDTAIERMWNMMMSFDGYSFCKPHSASYARVSYQAAYLKTHFPAEFMAAVISNRGGFYSTFAYVSEAKRLGLTIEPPDVRYSGYSWQGKGRRVRVGLSAISGLSRETVETIITMRHRPYHDCGDFLYRVQPAADEARALAHAGALDGLAPHENRATLLWEIRRWEQKKEAGASSLLFGPGGMPNPHLPSVPTLEKWRNEYRVLGFLCTMHPITLVRDKGGRSTKARDVVLHVGSTIRFAGWLLTGKTVSTKTGEVMEFLTFEDETGLVETTFFPGIYNRYAHVLDSGRPYLLEGLVESDYGAVTLTVKRVEPVRRSAFV